MARLGLPLLCVCACTWTCAVLGGCGFAPAPHATPLPLPLPEARTVRAGTDEWSRTDWEERHDTMTWSVLPNMARKFQAFSGTQYPELSCFSCHGADAEKVAYAMPHGLPALDPEHLPSPHSANAREARYATFMTDVVTPTLAALLDKPDVSCMTCHPRAGDE